MSKITELNSAIASLSTAVTALSTAVDRVLEVLGAPSTPDADILPIISSLEGATTAVNNAAAKLNAATGSTNPT